MRGDEVMTVNVRAKRILGSLAAALLLAALGATPGAAQITDVDRAMGVGGPTGLPSPGGATDFVGPIDLPATTQKDTEPGPKPKPKDLTGGKAELGNLGTIGAPGGILMKPKPKPGPKDLTGTIGSLDGIRPKPGTLGSLDGIKPKPGATGIVAPDMKPGAAGVTTPLDIRGATGITTPSDTPSKTGIVTPNCMRTK